MRSRASWWEKANALAPAMPGATVRSIALLLAIAEHETGCGDAWPGEHNWGATTRRGLSQADQAALSAAGVVPVLQPSTQRHVSESLATEALRAAGIDPPDAAIHVDSRPPGKVYFTWFAKFPDDAAGAAYFASFFRTAAEKQGLADGSPAEEAWAMFAAHYYTGTHLDDPSANVADYLRAIDPFFRAALAALEGWTPGADPPVYTEPAEPDLATTLGVQQALNRLCPDCAPLVEDGIDGPKTRAAIATWQRAHGLAVDGIAGAATVRSLRDALAA